MLQGALNCDQNEGRAFEILTAEFSTTSLGVWLFGNLAFLNAGGSILHGQGPPASPHPPRLSPDFRHLLAEIVYFRQRTSLNSSAQSPSIGNHLL